MSTGLGSETSDTRCKRIPASRWSRTACWAAAMDLARPTVIGRTMPGNSTVLRTGTMISASAGKGGSVVVCPPAPSAVPFFASISFSATPRLRLLQSDHQAAVGDGAAHAAIAACRQAHAAVKAALRKFKPVNGGSPQHWRIGPCSGNYQIIILDHRLGLLGVDTGQGDQRHHLEIRF